jgi:hypothetical protein
VIVCAKTADKWYYLGATRLQDLVPPYNVSNDTEIVKLGGYSFIVPTLSTARSCLTRHSANNAVNMINKRGVQEVAEVVALGECA